MPYVPSMSNIYQGLLSGAPNSMQGISGTLNSGFGGMLPNPIPSPSLYSQPPAQPLAQQPLGPWSNLAYRMAGSPQQGGPLPGVSVPSGPGISGLPTGSGSSGSGGGSSMGGLLGGVLGTVARNPDLVKSLGGLLGGAPIAAAPIASTGAIAAGTDTGAVASSLMPFADTPFVAAPVVAAPVAAAPALAAADAAPALAAADAAPAAAAPAATSGGLGATAAAALPWLAAAAAVAAPIWGAFQPTVELTPKYWQNFTNSLQGGKSNPQFYGSAMEALNMPQSQVPANIQQMIWQSGLVPQGTWGMSGGGFGGSGGAHNVSRY